MTGANVLRSGEGLIRSHAALLVVLTLWAFTPLVALTIYVLQHGGTLTGANGTDAFDQMAYLAWIRDEGSHLLASNLWQIGPTPHDYLHPMYVISAALWRLGLSLQLSYLIWKPVAVLVLFAGWPHTCVICCPTVASNRRRRCSWRSSTSVRCWRSPLGLAV